jgi:hypothetical protein
MASAHRIELPVVVAVRYRRRPLAFGFPIGELAPASHEGRSEQLVAPMSEFHAKWFYSGIAARSNWKHVAALFEKFIESGKPKLSIEFTCPEIESLQRRLSTATKALKFQDDWIDMMVAESSLECRGDEDCDHCYAKAHLTEAIASISESGEKK